MKKITILVLFVVLLNSLATGQISNDSIIIKKGAFGGSEFHQNNKRLTMSQLVKILKPNELAYKDIKSAQTGNTFAAILGGAGGFLIGYTLGTSIGGGESNWAVAGIGAGLIVAAIPIGSSANKKAISAVNKYNEGLKTISFLDKTEWKIAYTDNGIGLLVSF